jgi:hypothetical protein
LERSSTGSHEATTGVSAPDLLTWRPGLCLDGPVARQQARKALVVQGVTTCRPGGDLYTRTGDLIAGARPSRSFNHAREWLFKNSGISSGSISREKAMTKTASGDTLIPFTSDFSAGTRLEVMAAAKLVVCRDSGGPAAHFTGMRKSKDVQKRYNRFATRGILAKAD